MDFPSPPPSSEGSAIGADRERDNDSASVSDNSTLLSADMDFDPLAFVGLDEWAQGGGLELLDQPQMNQQWPDLSNAVSTIAPNDTVNLVPFNTGNHDFQYDFSFGQGMLTLPSPPNTNSSVSDPPSPMHGLPMQSFNGNVPVFDSTLAGFPQHDTSASTSVNSSPSQGVKRSHTASNASRSKTSHTTIERRYRTNLNARLVQLRASVPALRVLDKNIEPPEGIVDVINDRGYVDGVKAAKKNSKATILGKATEYIKVLKRREARLRGELQALQTVVINIVPDGQSFVSSWHANHQAQFGGEESDELAPEDENDDDEDDDEEGAREEAPAKPSKKQKTKSNAETKQETKKSPPPIILGPNGEPIKRKRGRPRKIQPPVEGSEVSVAPAAPTGDLQFQVDWQAAPPPQVVIQQPAQPARYLLAAFAFFSFFGNTSKAPHSTSASSHEGTVMNHIPTVVAKHSFGWINDDLVKGIHILTSLLLLLSILAPYLPGPLRTSRLVKMLTVTGSEGQNPEDSKPSNVHGGHTTKLDLDNPFALVLEYVYYLCGKKYGQVEASALKKHATQFIVGNEPTSNVVNLRLYYALASCPDALPERALIGFNLFPLAASKLWKRVQDSSTTDAYHLSLIDARRTLTLNRSKSDKDNVTTLLTRARALECLKMDAQRVFTERILGTSNTGPESQEAKDKMQDKERSPPRELTGRHREILSEYQPLMSMLDALDSGSLGTLPDITSSDPGDEIAQVADLLTVTHLFLRLFPGHNPTKSIGVPLSPPPSPSGLRNREAAKHKHELRCLLARDAFEGGAVEQAREAIVDILTRP